MGPRKGKGFLWVALSLIAHPVFAQGNPPYLASANLYVSVEDWADIWLNGIPIVDSQPFTPAGKGYQTIVCMPQHLCYFQRENILAIKNSKAYRNPLPRGERGVGFAYILRMRFSDGTSMTVSSNEVGEHKAFYIRDRLEGEPQGWHKISFDDSAWMSPNTTGVLIPGPAPLSDPQTGQAVEFLSASGISPWAGAPGERHLYRRKFFLDISPNPLCVKAEKLKATPTADWFLSAPRMIEPVKNTVPAAIIEAKDPVPSPAPTAEIEGTQAQTVIFEQPPANIYVNFADGPGTYRLEVRNASSRLLKVLFEKRVVTEGDSWVSWDGRDGVGNEAPAGQYIVFFSKDGKELNKIIVVKSASQ